MRINPRQIKGVTLIELMVFIIIVSVALAAMIAAFNFYVSNSVDPIVQLRALECAQAKMDEIIARKFDESSPTGGIPACGSAEVGAVACNGISVDSDFDDIGDFNGQVDNSNPDCAITVSVVAAGAELSIANDQVRRVTVNVVSPLGGNATLSSYRANY